MSKWLLIGCLLFRVVSFGQVNLQTGAAEVGFPLYSYADGKSRLGTSISLNYISGNGIKTNHLASNVGTGWALQAGGTITRILHGEPDDQFYPLNLSQSYRDELAYTLSADRFYPYGYMYSTTSPLNAVPNVASHIPYFPKNAAGTEYKANFEDREQDIYVFQFNNREGQFVIGKNKAPQVLEDSKLQITFVEEDMTANNIRTRIKSFTITDEMGIQYKFSEQEVTEIFKYEYTVSVNGIQVHTGVPLHPFAINKIITRWFLAEIINPLTNEKIIFSYDSPDIDMQGNKHTSFQSVVGEDTDTRQVLVERTKMTTKRLTSISLPGAQTVNFSYASTERVDLPGEKALTGINVLYGGNLVYGYQFNYGYLFQHEIKPYNYSFQTQEKRYARLCLTDFRKTGTDGTSLNPYVFTYNVPVGGGQLQIIPPAFTLYSDHWGYFNSSGPIVSEDANGFPTSILSVAKYFWNDDNETIKYAILTSVKYPEGGTLTYEYEFNKAEASTFQGKYAGGIRVSRTIQYDGVSTSNNILRQYKYVNGDVNGTSSAWGFEIPQYVETKYLRQYNASGSAKSGINVAPLIVNFVGRTVNSLTGSLLSSVFGQSFGATTAFSLKAIFTNLAIAVVFWIIDILFNDPFDDYTLTVVKSDNSNLMNPLPFQYARVEVIDEGNNSKVVYQFSNPSEPNYSLLDPGPYNAPFSTKQRFAHWIYGLPRIVTWYKTDGTTPVKKIENIYNPIVQEIQNSNFVSRSWIVNSMVSASWNAWNADPAIFESGFLTVETPRYPRRGRAELTKTIETIYKSATDFAASETEYTYSPNNFQLRRVSKKDSKGDYTGITTYYVADYNIAGVTNNMKTANMVNLPVSVNDWIKGPLQNDNEKLLSSAVTEYTLIAGGDFRPYQLYQSELTAPLDNTVADVDNFSPTNFKNYSYLKHQATMVYNEGNLAQQTVIPGYLNTSKIYDYNQRFVVAEATYAMQSRICYTSFESDGTGGWIYSPAGVRTTYSPMGKKCFDLASGNIELVNWGIPGNSTISMWTTGSEIFVTRSFIGSGSNIQLAPTRTGPTINGWKYCEFTLDLGEIDLFYISGNGLIDELRLHPAKARMTTYCYEPGIGKTAECDATNRIVYYEYDKLGRLIQVRDQYRNLLKAYEYNYKQ